MGSGEHGCVGRRCGEKECTMKKTKFSERKGEHRRTRVLASKGTERFHKEMAGQQSGRPFRLESDGSWIVEVDPSVFIWEESDSRVWGRGLRKWLSAVSGSRVCRVGDSMSE